MIKPEIFYVLECDRCKRTYEMPDGLIGNVDEEYVLNDAYDNSWIEHEGKHYCPFCYAYSEEKDENIPLPPYPKSLFKLEKFLKTYVGYRDAEISEEEDCFIVTVSLVQKIRLREEFLHMIRLILTMDSWEHEVKTYRENSASKLTIKIEKK